MGLIDADALKKKIEDHVTTVSVCPTSEWARGESNFKRKCLEDIEEMPMFDTEPIVKCHECTLRGSWSECPYFAWAGETPPDDWYCGKGNRRMTYDE